jgi:hypothetical protein
MSARGFQVKARLLQSTCEALQIVNLKFDFHFVCHEISIRGGSENVAGET